MKITVNGQELSLAASCTVRQLLERLELAAAPCAVEINATLLPKGEHSGHALTDGDTVEIVTLVGGG